MSENKNNLEVPGELKDALETIRIAQETVALPARRKWWFYAVGAWCMISCLVAVGTPIVAAMLGDIPFARVPALALGGFSSVFMWSVLIIGLVYAASRRRNVLAAFMNFIAFFAADKDSSQEASARYDVVRALLSVGTAQQILDDYRTEIIVLASVMIQRHHVGALLSYTALADQREATRLRDDRTRHRLIIEGICVDVVNMLREFGPLGNMPAIDADMDRNLHLLLERMKRENQRMLEDVAHVVDAEEEVNGVQTREALQRVADATKRKQGQS